MAKLWSLNQTENESLGFLNLNDGDHPSQVGFWSIAGYLKRRYFPADMLLP